MVVFSVDDVFQLMAIEGRVDTCAETFVGIDIYMPTGERDL